MSLASYLGKRRLVVIDGRRFIVRPITVATVAVAHAATPAAITAARAFLREKPEMLSPEGARILAEAFTTDDTREAIAEILSTFVEVVGALDDASELREVVTPELAGALAFEAARMCDLRRVADEAGLLKEEAEAEAAKLVEESYAATSQGLTPFEIAIFGVAEMLSRDPREVFAWPFELFLDACAASSILHPRAGAEVEAPVRVFGDAAAMNLEGIAGYEDRSPR